MLIVPEAHAVFMVRVQLPVQLDNAFVHLADGGILLALEVAKVAQTKPHPSGLVESVVLPNRLV